MAEPSAQFVVSVLGEANGDSFTVQVGLETIGKVYKSGLAHDLGRWVWSEPPYNVSGSLLAGERGPGDFDTRLEAVWALLSARFKGDQP